MGRANPFTPAAGAEPPTLIGREDVLFDFEESLLAGVGAPARLMRIAGPRGSGKTVLLNKLSEIARKHVRSQRPSIEWRAGVYAQGVL